MELTFQAATPTERLYAYEQSMQIAERCGNLGCLWGELDNTGTVFLNHWDTYVRSQHTPEFKAEFNTVFDMLRFDERYGLVMRDEKRVVTLNDYEQRLMVRGLTDFRNDALRDGKPNIRVTCASFFSRQFSTESPIKSEKIL